MALNAGYGVVPFMLLLMVVNCLAVVSVRRGMPEPYVLSVSRQDEEGRWNWNGNSGGSTLDPNSNETPDSSQSERTTSHPFPDPFGMYQDQPVDQGQDEVVQMKVRKLTFSSTGDSNFSVMPASVELSFNYASQLVLINLTRNENIPSHVPVFYNGSAEDSSWEDGSKFHDYAFYFDPKCMSSVLIEKVYDVKINTTVFIYSGSFYLNGVEFGFEPITQPSTAHRRTRRSMHPSKIHRARREALSDEQLQVVYQKNKISSDMLEIRNEPYLYNRFNGTMPPGLQFDVPAVKPAYLVKILAVIDYRVFVRWYNFSKASSVAEKNVDAFNNIRFYFGHVFNGVDMRYRSINDSAFSISTSLVGLYVAMKPTDALFVENNRENATVDANEALNDFISWLTTNQGLLPQYNQATLFTSDSLLGSSGNRISGLAIIMGMCTRFSVAICKDAGEYATIETAAHEIGHNLGGGHDGVSNLCSAKDMYIMTALPGLLDDNNYKNSFYFSPCSISEFRNFLGNLSASTSAADHCLLTTNETTNGGLKIDLGQRAGQKYTPDDQCVLIFGQGSYYCGGKTEDTRICRTMECFSPQLRYCYATYEQRAFTGTTCGNQSWCQLGDCVFDQKAPLRKSECTYGDYRGPYTNGLTCNTITSSAPWNCYDPAYSDDCCEGCPAIRNSSRVGCEFGNREGSCYTMGLFGCYDATVRTKCCDRCLQSSNFSGCEYGDKAEWCPSYIKTSIDCYAYSATCCDSCRKYDVGLPGCRYGDRASWCSTTSRAFCYTTANDCCYSCSRQYNASAVGCEYGNKADWCSGRQGYQCYIDAPICCETCRNFRTNISGCEFGDKHAMCQGTFLPSDCYTWSSYCCASCNSYFMGISGCEYGDRVQNCSSSDCVNSKQQEDCCFTCRNTTGMSSYNTTVISSPLLPTTQFSSTSTSLEPTTTTLLSSSTTLLSTATTTTTLLPTTSITLPSSAVTNSSATLPAITVLSSATTIMLPSTTATASTTTTSIATTTLQPTTTLPSTTTTLPSTITTTILPSTTTATTLPSTATTTALPSTTSPTFATTTTTTSTTTTVIPSTTTTTTLPSTMTTTISRLLSTSSSTALNLSPSTFSATSEASAVTSTLVSQPTTMELQTTVDSVSIICTNEGDKAPYCSNMPVRDCYVLADTCCQTCKESYMTVNGCEYGNRAGWCDSYLRNRDGCLRDDNAFWCCQTCAAIYGVQCSDSVPWCNVIRSWDCYDNLFQASLCCATCRQRRTGNHAGCEYGDRASWCGNYPLGFICATNRSQCCKTCQGWQ